MKGQRAQSGPQWGSDEARRALSCTPSSPSGLSAVSRHHLYLPARENTVDKKI